MYKLLLVLMLLILSSKCSSPEIESKIVGTLYITLDHGRFFVKTDFDRTAIPTKCYFYKLIADNPRVFCTDKEFPSFLFEPITL